MNLLTLTIKNLWNHRLRFVLTVLGVATSIATFVSLVGLTRNLEETLKTTYQTRGTDLVAVESGIADFLTSTIDESDQEKIKTLAGVDRVGGILVDYQAFKFKQYVLVYGWATDSYLFEELKIQGRACREGQEAIIGSLAAKRFSKKIGDKVSLKGKPFTIVGIYKSRSILEEGGVIVPLATLQGLKKVQGKVTLLNISVKKDVSRIDPKTGSQGVIRRAQEEIEAACPGLEVRNVDDFIANATPISNAFHFTWAITIVAFLVAVLGMVNMMMTSVLERSRDIGILRAIGWRSFKIMAMIILEGIFTGFLGGIAGLVFGYGLMKFLAGMPQLDGLIRIVYDQPFCARVIISSIALGFIAGLYPAGRAVSIKPLEVLRYE